LLLLLAFFLRRRYQRRAGKDGRAEADSSAEVAAKLEDKPQLHSDPAVYYEMDAREQHEVLGDHVQPQELAEAQPRGESMPTWEDAEREGIRPV